MKQGILLIKTNSALGGLSPVAFEAIPGQDRPDAVFKKSFGFLSGCRGGKEECEQEAGKGAAIGENG